MWKGGLHTANLPRYETYNKRLFGIDETRKDTNGVLETRCVYCNRWYVPNLQSVVDRVRFIAAKKSFESKFYCSDGCKSACPVYYQKKYPKGFKTSSSREVQPELRQLVLERDDYTCQKCNKTIDDVELHCHHITGVVQNPIESADVDNCITFCIKCHKNMHSKKGCTYNDLQCK